MIIAILTAITFLVIVIGGVMIAQWSYIAVKEYEYEQQDERQSGGERDSQHSESTWL